MSQSRLLALNGINKLAGSADCPACGIRILLLNLNKNYYCPNCSAPISVTVNRKPKPKLVRIISRKFFKYFDNWTLVYSIFYPIVLSIIPTLFLTSGDNGIPSVDLDSASQATFFALVMVYGVSIVAAVWKSLPTIIGMLFMLAIVVGVLMLFGIPPQASIAVIGFVLAAIFLIVRIQFILKNWRAVLAGVILLISPSVPYLCLLVNSSAQAVNTIFVIFFIYHALVANTCLIWLYRNSYTSKQAVMFIGTTPLIIAMLVMPFINKLGIDIDGIFDADIGDAPEPLTSLKESIAPEDPMTAPVQGDVAAPEAPEVATPEVPEYSVPEAPEIAPPEVPEYTATEAPAEAPAIIAGPKSGVPHDILTDYYIESEIIVNPQSHPIINLNNVEVDYYASQQSPDTCAIASQRMIIADQTGINYPEAYLLKYAEKCGYYTQGQGTPLDLTGQLLKDAGLEVIEADPVSLEQIDIALQHDYSVSENLDPNEYINPRYDGLGNPVELPDEMGHNVKVVSINKDLSGTYTSVVINDPVVGPHIEIPVADYMNARSDFGNTVFAKKIA
jgi:hypothetical protein